MVVRHGEKVKERESKSCVKAKVCESTEEVKRTMSHLAKNNSLHDLQTPVLPL